MLWLFLTHVEHMLYLGILLSILQFPPGFIFLAMCSGFTPVCSRGPIAACKAHALPSSAPQGEWYFLYFERYGIIIARGMLTHNSSDYGINMDFYFPQ